MAELGEISFNDQILPILLAFGIFFLVLYILAGREITDYLFGTYSLPPSNEKKGKSAPKPRNFTKAELEQYTGQGEKSIYIGVSGNVFDMSESTGFYGPGGPYHCFAGRDATIGLATMELDPSKWDQRSWSDLSQGEKDTLDDWVQKFEMKYPLVGYLTDGVNAKRDDSQEAAGKKTD
eukprot:gb/GECG01016735.1/.p1 GENE.gb/GECG01016735.1/~~gb/GECG01016735.1/.p1  ORF type:complete len:178 (+),score=25.74 gb/GECG01016735.1/:1-534(+)